MAQENEGEQLELFDEKPEQEYVTLGEGGLTAVAAVPMRYGIFYDSIEDASEPDHPREAEGFYLAIDDETCAWITKEQFEESFEKAPALTIH